MTSIEYELQCSERVLIDALPDTCAANTTINVLRKLVFDHATQTYGPLSGIDNAGQLRAWCSQDDFIASKPSLKLNATIDKMEHFFFSIQPAALPVPEVQQIEYTVVWDKTHTDAPEVHKKQFSAMCTVNQALREIREGSLSVALFSDEMRLHASDELLADCLTGTSRTLWAFQSSVLQEAVITEPSEVFAFMNDWIPIKNQPLGLSIFVSTLAMMKGHGTGGNSNFSYDDVPKFIEALRKFVPFHPTILAFKHVMDGYTSPLERLMIGRSFFRLLRSYLPSTVDNNLVFNYTTVVFAHILHNAADITESSFNVWNIRNVNNELIQSPFVSKTSLNLMLIEENQIAQQEKPDYWKKSSFVGFLVSIHKDIPLVEYSTDSTRTDPLKLQQIQIHQWTPAELVEFVNVVSSSDKLCRFSFLSSEHLGKGKGSQSAMYFRNYSGRLAVVEERAGLVHNRLVFDEEMHYRFTVDKTDADADGYALKAVGDFRDADYLSNLNPPLPVQDKERDIRPLEEVILILVDKSGSMSGNPFAADKDLSGLDIAVSLFNYFLDGYETHELPHAVGFATFNSAVDLKVDVSRAFSDFLDSQLNDIAASGSTALYDAILLASKRIQTFCATRSEKTLFKRIILLSDGGENCSKATADEVAEALQVNNIVLDYISIASMVDKQVSKLAKFSRGAVLLMRSKAELFTIFDREAFSSLKFRQLEPIIDNWKDHASGTQDVVPLSKTLEQVPAKNISAVVIKESANASRITRNIVKDIIDLQDKPMDGVSVFVDHNNLFFWKVILKGPDVSPYANRFFLLTVQFPHNYPLAPPLVRFTTAIYHCNINKDGKICHEVFTRWSPKRMRAVLSEIVSLLQNPNPDSPLDTVIAQLYRDSKDKYLKTATSFAKAYAAKSVEELVQLYYLTN